MRIKHGNSFFLSSLKSLHSLLSSTVTNAQFIDICIFFLLKVTYLLNLVVLNYFIPLVHIFIYLKNSLKREGEREKCKSATWIGWAAVVRVGKDKEWRGKQGNNLWMLYIKEEKGSQIVYSWIIKVWEHFLKFCYVIAVITQMKNNW